MNLLVLTEPYGFMKMAMGSRHSLKSRTSGGKTDAAFGSGAGIRKTGWLKLLPHLSRIEPVSVN